MPLYLLRKLAILLLSLFCIITATFFLMKAAPGDPFMDEGVTAEVLQSLKAYYGLDRPIWVQYLCYLKGFVTFDFGRSIVYHGRSVASLVANAFPVSAILGLQALLLLVPSGILLGTWAALQRSKWQDHLAMLIATIGISVPNFVFSALLQNIVGLKMGLLPIARWGSFEHTILPTIALAAMPMAFIARLTRANMVEVLQQNYIRTALAKGLPLSYVALRHGLRNALLPVISYLGPVSAQVLTGSFVVENVFAIPGLGQWLVSSIHNRDYPLIMGITVFYSALLMIAIFLSDCLYALLDPRLKRERAYE